MIRILVVDDHTLVRAGLCRLMEAEEDLEVVGQTGSGREAIVLYKKLRPDVVLLDYRLPDLDGQDVAERILAESAKARVLVLTMHGNEEYAIRLVRSGVAGFVVKGAAPEELLAAIRKVHGRGTYISPEVLDKMVDRMGKPADEAPEAGLSTRELQVLVRLGRGATTREVCDELGLSLSTVETYRSRLLEKLSLRNNSDLTRFAIRRGLIDLE